MLPGGGEPGGPDLSCRIGGGAVGPLLLFLADGSVQDLSGVLLSTTRAVEESHAGLGYVAFASATTVGRLVGNQAQRQQLALRQREDARRRARVTDRTRDEITLDEVERIAI
jgi:hypothetical protein